MAATSTTVQVCTYNSQNDASTLVLDLNDGVTYKLMHLRLAQPPKVPVKSWNIRSTRGETVTRKGMKNRVLELTLQIKGANSQAAINAYHTLIGAMENPETSPYVLKLGLYGSTNTTLWDVATIDHVPPYQWQEQNAGLMLPLTLLFEVAPQGRGARQVRSNAVSNPGFEVPNNQGVQVFADTFANTTAYATYTGSNPTVSANVMTIPLNAGVTFGSPVWSAINNWQVRFQAANGMNVFFVLHRTDANNQLRLNVSLTQIQLQHIVAGVSNVLATATPTLTNGTFYWLQFTQFSAVAGLPPNLQASLFNDSAGTVGSAVASGSVGPVAAHDAVTALIGQPAIEADGAALSIGGNFPGVHLVQLFGPGGWAFTPQNGSPTGVCSGAWDGTRPELGMSGNATVGAQTYGGGPVSSFGAARVTLPPGGSVNGMWTGYNGGAPANTSAIPVSSPGNVVKVSAWTITSGLAGTGSVQLYVQEWNASGVNLRATQVVVLSGNQASWTQMSGSVTTGANTAYVSVQLLVVDGTANSANATVWFDNVQCWDSTRTGMTSMPYCETRFPQSPAQLVVSGIVGDVPAPTLVSIGTYVQTTVAAGGQLTVVLGRRQQASAGATLVAAQAGNVLDANSYGGCYAQQTAFQSTLTTAFFSPLAVLPASHLGAYQVMTRLLTAEATANLPSAVKVQLWAWQKFPGAPSVYYTNFTGTALNPLTTQNVWVPVLLGDLNIPFYVPGGLSDLTKWAVQPAVQLVDSHSGGATWNMNWQALMPSDGETLILAVLAPPSGPFGASTIGTGSLFVYADGLAIPTAPSFSTGRPSLAVGQSSLPIPAPSMGLGGGGNSQSWYTPINSVGDAIVNLDPAPQAGAMAGINQFVGLVTDNVATVEPIDVEFTYEPYYLWPQ